MKSIVKWFAVAGGLIPIVLIVAKFIELYFNSQTVPYSVLYGIYLWPTALVLMGFHHGFDLQAILWYAMSILVNVLLYTIIGLVVGGMWKLFLRLRGVTGSLPTR